MKKMNSVIMDLQDLRGANIEIFGQPTTLENEVDELTIDIIPILEDLKEYEVDMFIERPADDEDDEWEVIQVEDIEEYLTELESHGYIADVDDYKADNSYNWMAPISNHFDFKVYDLQMTGGKLIEMKVHRYGDVRGNYTETVLLEFDDDYTFLEIFAEHSKREIVEVDGIEWIININPFSDMMEVESDELNYHFETYGTEMEDIIKQIKEEVQ